MSGILMRSFARAGPDWNAVVARLPGSHLLQTWEWAQVKARFGWQPMPIVWERDGGKAAEVDSPIAAALVLKRSVLSRGFARRLCMLYVPRGPLLQWDTLSVRNQVLDDLQGLARQHGAILLKIDPHIEIGKGYAASNEVGENATAQELRNELAQRRWRFSGDQVQFRNTVVLDLTRSEEELLGRMKQKTRYNIRLAEKKGITVRPGTTADLPVLYQMYAETSERDQFVIRQPEYYRTVWEAFLHPFTSHAQPSAQALIAEAEGEPVAAILAFYFAQRAYYLYGMSRAIHREKMPNHLLQWEAIRRSKRLGCEVYDLWGAPDRLEEDDPLWGVYRFKEGFGGEVVRTIGAWDFPASALWYAVYTQLMPRVLNVMRTRARQRVHDALGAA